MTTDDAIPNKIISTYSHDFLGVNLAQMGDWNQFVNGVHIIPFIACITTVFGVSISLAS
jgi:hypothetical protein